MMSRILKSIFVHGNGDLRRTDVFRLCRNYVIDRHLISKNDQTEETKRQKDK